MLRRQAVVNDGVTLVFNDRTGERAEKIEYFYEHGIQDYANEIAGEGTLTPVYFLLRFPHIGRDRDDQPEYQVKMNVAFCFSNAVQTLEYCITTLRGRGSTAAARTALSAWPLSTRSTTG